MLVKCKIIPKNSVEVIYNKSGFVDIWVQEGDVLSAASIPLDDAKKLGEELIRLAEENNGI